MGFFSIGKTYTEQEHNRLLKDSSDSLQRFYDKVIKEMERNTTRTISKLEAEIEALKEPSCIEEEFTIEWVGEDAYLHCNTYQGVECFIKVKTIESITGSDAEGNETHVRTASLDAKSKWILLCRPAKLMKRLASLLADKELEKALGGK